MVKLISSNLSMGFENQQMNDWLTMKKSDTVSDFMKKLSRKTHKKTDDLALRK
jgi:hypothetical protein